MDVDFEIEAKPEKVAWLSALRMNSGA